MRWLVLFAVLYSGAWQSISAQENPTQTKTKTVVCTFQDGKEISARYEVPEQSKKKDLPSGELWPSSGSPIYLFTQTNLMVGNTEIPAGAYSMYVIPEKEKWTLVINKAVSADTPYDQQQDLLRSPMEVGHVSEPQPFELVFVHIAPQQCNLRVYAGETGTWAEFKEK